ncbi:MAG: FtsX-like permease family protein [Anaerolineae bacterium]|nr:FtsX-like permease family protein [Anaerolineae bacterium]
MNVIWHKVWSDLWEHKVRTLLAVISIAAGVFALGAVFGMIDQLIPNLNRVHRTVEPAHITIFLADRIDWDIAHGLEKIDGVAGVDLMNITRIRYKLNPEQDWQPGVLIMREYDNQHYNLLHLKAGDWPKRNRVGVDIRSATALDLAFGDQVIFELDGTDRALPINGHIRYHFMTSPDFGDNTHFFVDGSGLERFDIPNGEFNQLLVQVSPYSPELAREVASEIKERLGKEGIGLAETFYNDPAEHWGSRFFDGLNLVLQLLGVVSLFLSVILIFNTLTALITQQTNQIGVMKAIGGSTTSIIKVYLIGVLVYGSLSLFVALPLGAWTAYSAARYFLDIFNVDHSTFQFSSRALLIQTGAAIGVPLLAALWPVLSGTLMTVREAISSYGLGGDFGTSPLDRTVERLAQRFLSAPYAIALGNLFRRKGRLGLTQVVLITAGTLFLMVMTLSASIRLTVDNELARQGNDATLIFEDNQRADRMIDIAESLPTVETAELRFSQSAALLKEGQHTTEAGVGARLIGVPEESRMGQPFIVAGRWLQPGDGQVIVINEETAEDNDIAVGDTVTLDLGELGDDAWLVVGHYRILSIGVAPDFIYAPQEVIFRVTPKHNVGNELLLTTRTTDPAMTEAVTNQLKGIYEQRSWEIADTETIHEVRSFFDNFFAQYIPMLLALAVIVAMVGGIGLMGALSISVVERTKEIGVMRAIGAKTSVIMGMFVLEGILQGLLSWLVAVPLSFLLGQPLAGLMGQSLFDMNLDYRYDFSAVLIWLVAVLLISALASVLPARNATAISVRESLAYA